jgi:S1-C subfamily serine protease
MSHQAVTCPACGGTLRIAANTPPGAAFRCPYCSQSFAFGVSPLQPVRHRRRRQQPWPLYLSVGAGAFLAVCFAILLLTTVGGRREAADEDQEASSEAETTERDSAAEGWLGQAAEGSAGRASVTSAVPILTTPPPPEEVSKPLTPAANSGPAGPDLRYRWKTGDRYAYDYAVHLDVDDEALDVTGVLVYTLKSAAEVFGSDTETCTAIGTAFVVNSSGYLLSCAHVVEDATKIEVRLGEATYEGKVIALDEKHDVALLRISASGLPVLPLADSDAVQLAEEVRAVGFPLAGLLGSSLKVTRGSIAGIVSDEDMKLLQVDGNINPGNSGGPLVQERGAVIGVVSAKLREEKGSGVGFAVPINVAKQLLRDRNIPFATQAAAQALDGPELARRAAPAVALVTVTASPEQGGHGERMVLEVASYASVKTSSRGAEGSPGPGAGEYHTATLVVDQYGEVLHMGGDAIMPSLFGPLGQTALVQLSYEGLKRWTVERPTVVGRLAETPSTPEGRFGYQRPGRSRFGRFTPPPSGSQVVIHPAVERTTYEVEEPSGGTVVVNVRHELKTLQKPNEPPLARVAGDGHVTFDAAAGVATEMQFDGTIQSRVKRTVSIPFRVTYKPADLDTAEKTLASGAPVRTGLPGEVSPETLDEVVRVLQSPALGFFERRMLLEALAAMPPIEEKREAVAAALRPMLSELFLDEVTANVISVWGTEDDLVALAQKWRRLHGYARQTTVTRLGEMKTERAARTLVAIVGFEFEQSAVTALRGMGPVAEQPVLTLLTHRSASVRIEAYGILAEIGDRASISALSRQLRFDRDPRCQEAAKAALRNLRAKQ